jgi:hypothetical protein
MKKEKKKKVVGRGNMWLHDRNMFELFSANKYLLSLDFNC